MSKLASMLNEIMENVERGAPRTRQTAATDVLIFSKLLWLEFGAFWFSQICCGSSVARPRRSSLDVFHVFVVMFIDFSLISNVPS